METESRTGGVGALRAPFFLSVFFCATGLAVFAMSAAATGTAEILPKRTERQQQAADVLAKLDGANAPTREQFIAGSTTFVVHHEFGHFLIDEYKIPNLSGREEDMADAYATFELGPYTSAVEMQSAVRLWLYYAFRRGANPIAWWDDHSLDHQRAFQVACFLSGRWPNKYAGLPEAFGAPANRALHCARDSVRTQAAWVEVLRAQDAAMIDRHKAVVKYLPAPPELADAEKWLRASGILESIATEIQRYRLPDWRIEKRAELEKDMAEGRLPYSAFERTQPRVDVVGRRCGQANAFYRPASDGPGLFGIQPKGPSLRRPTLVVCYELIDEFRKMAVEAKLPEGE